MVECDFCDEEFDSERELHLHWGEEHEEELNSHQEEKVKKAERKKEEQKEAKSRKRRSLMLKGLTAVTALIFVALVLPQVLSMFKTSPFQLDSQPMMGSENASVTVVEFGDYRCPYCKQFDQNVFPKLKENYIDDGEVKFYFINFPILGPGSTLGAEAGECMQEQSPESFWDFHHTLYDRQGPESTRWITEELVTEIATDVSNVSSSEFKQCLDRGSISTEVQKDESIARGNGLSGTPSIFVNGKRVEASWESVKDAVEKELN